MMTHSVRPYGQARLVSGWLLRVDDGSESGGIQITVRNGSALPITKVAATIIDGRGSEAGDPKPVATFFDGFEALFDSIPPSYIGKSVVSNVSGAMGFRPAIQVGFTDASGHHWLRNPDGVFHQQAVPLWEHLGYDLNFGWTGVLAEGSIVPS
jgi:hypothetical protein